MQIFVARPSLKQTLAHPFYLKERGAYLLGSFSSLR